LLSFYAITSLLDMGLFSRRCPHALSTGVSTMRAVILSFPQTSSSFFLSSSQYFPLASLCDDFTHTCCLSPTLHVSLYTHTYIFVVVAGLNLPSETKYAPSLRNDWEMGME
jgi:hypothetical protein